MTPKMIGRESKMEGCGEERTITLFPHFCKPVSCKAAVSALLHLLGYQELGRGGTVATRALIAAV